MSSSPDLQQLGLDAYAALIVALAEGARPREDLLREQGLSEADWSAIDRAFQAELSRALDEEHEGVPPLIVAYSEAFERARTASRQGEALLSIERFGEATREIQRRGDPLAALSHLGIALSDYLKANEHWTRRMTADPELAQRFRGRIAR